MRPEELGKLKKSPHGVRKRLALTTALPRAPILNTNSVLNERYPLAFKVQFVQRLTSVAYVQTLLTWARRST
jgi:hypothetical protein